MAKKEGNRPKITLACTDCRRRNYHTVKNRVNDRDRIEMKKYCRWCRGHTLHQRQYFFISIRSRSFTRFLTVW